jgi:hypothetical protein
MVKEWAPFLNKDYDISTTSTWNYALVIGVAHASSQHPAVLFVLRISTCRVVFSNCRFRGSDPKAPGSSLTFDRAGAPGAYT